MVVWRDRGANCLKRVKTLEYTSLHSGASSCHFQATLNGAVRMGLREEMHSAHCSK